MRAALYGRVSTDLQEKEQTIESQIEALRRYAEAKRYDVVREYRDEGYSGATLVRPGLDQFRDAARASEFDVVLFHSPDRLARKAVYQGLILEELEKAGVKVEFLNHPVDDSPEGRMLLGMQGLFAEYERAKIIERNRRGKLHWAKQGALMGGYVPYGYRYVPRNKETGHRATLEIDESQATVVRDMYHWLVEERLSCRAIAKRLTELNVPTAKGRKFWKPSSVNRMLKQPVYRGIFYYHRAEAVEPSHRHTQTRYPKYKLTGRKLRSQEEWITIQVPAIIDGDTWEAAQRQLHQNFLHSPRHNVRHQYLLRGLIRCSKCGATYVGAFSHGRRCYHCNRIDYLAAGDGRRCGGGWMQAEPVEDTVWSAIAEALQKPESLLHEYQRREAEAEAPNGLEVERRATEVALKRVKSQQDRLTDAYLNGAVEMPQFKAKMDELRRQKELLEKRLAEIDTQIGCSQQEADVMVKLETFCQTVAKGLDKLTFEEKQVLLRLLVEKVVIENGKVRVDTIITLKEGPEPVALRPPCFQRGAGGRLLDRCAKQGFQITV